MLISGIQTQREDVPMNSVPITTREEKVLCRTSGGCPSTGQQVHRGRSTTAGPSTLTNPLRCWTLAPHRPRSLPRTRARRSSDRSRPTPRQTRTGTTGKHKVCLRAGLQTDLGVVVCLFRFFFLSRAEATYCCWRKSLDLPIISSQLERESTRTLFTSKTKLFCPSSPTHPLLSDCGCEWFVPWRKTSASFCHLDDGKILKRATLFKLTRSVRCDKTEWNAHGCLVPWTII